ncbi:MAG: T9SS type A sorting domain-containing protein [Chitinophagales bacterium]|nr:T9SS type A sorting domain-containing protein [Chitinophagales bacterium]
MIKLLTQYIFIILLAIPISVSAHEACNLPLSEKSSRIKVQLPDNKEDRLMLIALLEIDHYYVEENALITEVPNSKAKLLQQLPYKHQILCDDVELELQRANKKYYDAVKENPHARVAFENSGDTVGSIIKMPNAFQVKNTLGGYYNYAEMVTAIGNLFNAYPGIVDTFSLGRTLGNRDIWCVKISDNVLTDENEPELGYMGLQHAREAIGGASMLFFMQYLAENYSVDARIKDLVDNREFFIIPCMNPDGWEYNRSTNPNGGGMWRKNRRQFGAEYGVDLNRNWGVRWADCSAPISGPVSSCGSNTTSSSTYWGPSAFSERESQAIRAFALTRNFSIFLDQHAFGPYYSIPPGRQPDALSSDELKFYIELCSSMGKYNGMKYGNSYEALAYEVAGGVKDWMLRGDIGVGTKGKVYGFTGEGGAGGGTSGNNFWPPADKIVILCKGMTYQNIQMAYFAGSYVDHQDLGVINITSTTGNLPYRIRRLGLQNLPITVTALPLQNITITGSPAVTSLANFNDVYNGNISYSLPSGIAAGNIIKYIWKVETNACTYYDTIVKVYNGVTVMSDNMEGASATTNWTISGGGWAYTSDRAFSGSKSFAESPSSNYSASTTRTAQWNSLLSLSGAGSAYMSFMVRHRAENFCDKLSVQISTNGSTWISLTGKTTVQEPNNWDGSTINGEPALTGIREEWTREIFDLKDFVGLSNLRLRFHFTTVNTDANYVYNVDQGFNIDNLSIIMGGNPNFTLPLELLQFSGRHETPNNLLSWTTASEKNTSRFNIERSADGLDFETIGTVLAAGNSTTIKSYAFIDTKPFFGDNLYRLKMIDADETFTYSKLISIKVNNENNTQLPSGIHKIYPNPTNATLSVDFNSQDENALYNMMIYDVTGKIQYFKSEQLSFGINKLEFDVSNLANGQYVLAITQPAKRITYEQKFVKQ